MNIKQIKWYINNSQKNPSKDVFLAHSLLSPNHHQICNQLSPTEKVRLIRKFIYSKNKYIQQNLKILIANLKFDGFADYPLNNKGCDGVENTLVDIALNRNDSKLFLNLLSHKNAVKNLDRLVEDFYPDDDNLYCWDMFRKIDPNIIKNKKPQHRRSYEILYQKLFDRYYSLELVHRLNLKLSSKQKKGEGETYEGQMTGLATRQLKDHLVDFLHDGSFNPSLGFIKAINQFMEIEARSRAVSIPYDKKNNMQLYIYSHFRHNWCAVLFKNKLWTINMGIGADKLPGIHVYKIPNNKITKLKSKLNLWSKTDLIDSLNDFKDYDDLVKNSDELLKRIVKAHEYNHFKDLPKDFNLKHIGYYSIPAQIMGNCTYYSQKGLLYALTLMHNQNAKIKMAAHDVSRKDLLNFTRYDYDHAVSQYQTHVIQTDKAIVNQAKKRLKLYRGDLKQHPDATLNKNIYNFKVTH